MKGEDDNITLTISVKDTGIGILIKTKNNF